MIKQIYNKMSYFASRFQHFLTKPEYKFFKEIMFSITATCKPIVASQARYLTDENNKTKHVDKRLRRYLKKEDLINKIVDANCQCQFKNAEKWQLKNT